MSSRRTRLAAYLVARNDGRLVLTRIASGFPGAGAWTLPGGGVEWGEHPEDALRREVYEESGLRFDVPEFVGIDSRVYDENEHHPAMHAVRLVYTAELSGVPTVTERDGSVDAAKWIERDDLSAVRIVDLVSSALELLDRHLGSG